MVRTLTDLDARPIPGTENAQYFVPSPSGEWATFHRDGAYYRIPYVGGRGEKILDAPLSFGGIWEDEYHVIFGSPVPGRGLVRVKLDTGEQEFLTEVDRTKGQIFHAIYQAFPDKPVLIYMASGWTMESNTIFAMSLETMETREIVSSAMRPYYVDTGHLVYTLTGRLMALPFDLDRLEATRPER